MALGITRISGKCADCLSVRLNMLCPYRRIHFAQHTQQGTRPMNLPQLPSLNQEMAQSAQVKMLLKCGEVTRAHIKQAHICTPPPRYSPGLSFWAGILNLNMQPVSEPTEP